MDSGFTGAAAGHIVLPGTKGRDQAGPGGERQRTAVFVTRIRCCGKRGREAFCQSGNVFLSCIGGLVSAIVDTLLGVGKALFGLRGELAKARKDRKETVAGFIGDIAETIDETAAALRRAEFPGGKCAELFAHSQQMETAIGDLIGPGKAGELAAQLQEIWEIERLFGELNADSPPERKRKLSVLDEAAGQFRATAAFVRASP